MMRKWLILTVVAVLTLVMIAGCSPSSEISPTNSTNQSNIEIDMVGNKASFPLDGEGKLLSRAEASSADGKISLSMDKRTVVSGTDKKPLGSILAVFDSSPPPAPEGAYIIGTVYRLMPNGAVVDPWFRIALGYEPDKLPQGIGVGDLYIAFHGGGSWQKMRYKSVDTAVNMISTQAQYLGRFCIMADKPVVVSTPVTGVQVGNLAPDFSLGASDQPGSLSGLRGKPVILNFWATWCNPCRLEMPFLQEVYKANSDKGLVMLAINLQESPNTVSNFMRSNNLSIPVVFDISGDIARKYKIGPIPVTYFIDKSGIIRAVKIGAFLNKAEIESNVNKILP